MNKLQVSDIDIAIRHFGNLTIYGLGVYEMFNGGPLIPRKERLELISKQQEGLRECLDEVQAIYDWLPFNLPKSKRLTIHTRRSSYGLKWLA